MSIALEISGSTRSGSTLRSVCLTPVSHEPPADDAGSEDSLPFHSETSSPELPATFASLGLKPDIVSGIASVGYIKPSPIQVELIPHAIAGRDCIGQAQTGTGKTAAFVLPFLHHWRDSTRPGPQALILAPTRELVAQVAEEARKLSQDRHCRVAAIYGGQRIGPQLTALKQGCAIVVGTPGRILDHLSRGTLQLDAIEYVVLDEADRMLDIGFRPDIERILKRCPKERQTMLMSATVPDSIQRLIHRYMVDPLHINLAPVTLTVDRIAQSFFTVEEDRKFELLLRVIARERPRQCIIFSQRKKWADRLYAQLKRVYRGIAVIHGDLPQSQREKIMQDFRDLKIRCLIATDVVSRGIDVSGISHIINYDLPEDVESYVHRIGRTGRMGKDGVAISFVTPEQGDWLTAIETTINRLIEADSIDGFEGFTPRAPAVPPPPKPPSQPVYGRSRRKYSDRL